MNKDFDLQQYMTEGVERIVADALREGDYLSGDHDGGCVLFEKKEEVERIYAAI